MLDLGDYAPFHAKRAEISPGNFTLEKLKGSFDNILRSKVAIKNGVQEPFATLGGQGEAGATPASTRTQRLQE